MQQARRWNVTALFDSRKDAEDAVERLIAMRIPKERIRLAPGNEIDPKGDPDIWDEEVPTPQQRMGILESLRGLFFPDDERFTYGEHLRRGCYLVSVEVTDAEHDRALDILDDEGTVDMDAREDRWRAGGWAGPVVPLTAANEDDTVWRRDPERSRPRVRSYVGAVAGANTAS
ncbi:MAG: hypothetical protein JF625_20490 [Inquilinus limosus]|uniref:Uncharacterized protein n=1 Tax=Inquilinus limosus TaxID=171674 RepID=A0A952FSJ0_9PROT|nr:hypothetical protein [Inquilinus limosus]